MGSFEWGSVAEIPHSATRKTVNIDAEITKGGYVYLATPVQAIAIIPTTDWLGLSNVMGSLFAGQIAQQIQGARAVWTKISWSGAVPNPVALITTLVTDLKIECVVKNENAGLTGLEVVAVLTAVAVLSTVIALIAVAAWVVAEILAAAKDLGDGAVIAIGLVILFGIGALLFFMFGGTASGNKKGVTLKGRGA